MMHYFSYSRFALLHCVIALALYGCQANSGVTSAVKAESTNPQTTVKVKKSSPLKATKPVVSGHYLIHDNATVTDTKTGLMWKQCSEGQYGIKCRSGEYAQYLWDDAMSRFRSGVSFAGYNDWRMPTKEELNSLVSCPKGWDMESNQRRCLSVVNYSHAMLNTEAFPYVLPLSSGFWSSSLSAGHSGEAWYTDFGSGYTGETDTTKASMYALQIRLVRGR